MSFVAEIIHSLIRLITLIIVIDAVLSYFMSPFHPIRQTLDKFVEPMLAPVRKILPPMGGIDFSPLVLIILLQVLDTVIINILFRL